MKLKPLADNLLVEATKIEEATKSGIVLAQTGSAERPEQGTVIAVGPGAMHEGKLVPMHISVGDRVLFKKYGPDAVKIDGKDYLILSAHDVLGIFTE